MIKRLLPILTFATAALLALSTQAFEVKTVSINASAMKASYPATIVLPDSYKLSNKRFPVVYLLHGYSGNHQDWSKVTEVETLADKHQIIIVMPDGNYGSWYIDSRHKKNSNFETYIYKDVVNYTDKNFRSIASKEARAITGLSMGGFGALNIAVNHSKLFGAAGSLSGGVDPRPFQYNWQLQEMFGPLNSNQDYWDSKAIINNAHRFLFSGLDLYIDCGIEDFFIDSNRALRQKLLDLKVPHDYSERPGGHTWDYWGRTIHYQMQFFADGFNRKLKR